MPDEEQRESSASVDPAESDATQGEHATPATPKPEKTAKSTPATPKTEKTAKSATSKTSKPTPAKQATKSAPAEQSDAASSGGGGLSSYGLVSIALGLVSIAAVVVGVIVWSMHRSDVDERADRSQVLQTAASFTSVLINMNAENVENGMQRLRDETVGELNSQFDATVQPYREVVQRIKSRSTGRIEAVAIDSVNRDDEPDAAGSGGQSSEPPSGARHTDPVLVIATSIAENAGGKPVTVHWALRLDVSDVDGKLLISRMKSVR